MMTTFNEFWPKHQETKVAVEIEGKYAAEMVCDRYSCSCHWVKWKYYTINTNRFVEIVENVKQEYEVHPIT